MVSGLTLSLATRMLLRDPAAVKAIWKKSTPLGESGGIYDSEGYSLALVRMTSTVYAGGGSHLSRYPRLSIEDAWRLTQGNLRGIAGRPGSI